MVGLIFSSIASGQVVARTGRYKWLLVGAILVMAVSMALMTQLRADTPIAIVWSWMFIAGLGVGPTFAVFTLVVQNAVPFHELGVATSNLTFFRQIGGTVSLAIVGTLFSTNFENQLTPSLTAAGVPGPLVAGFNQGMQKGSIDFNNLTGVGNLGTAILAATPPQLQAVVQPYISNIVAGIHDAFSLGVASTFWVGVVAALLAAGAAATMHELALRSSIAPSTAGAPAGQPAPGQAAGADARGQGAEGRPVRAAD